MWPGALAKWNRFRVPILLGVIAFAPLYRVGCHFLQLHGRADETFPAVADILAIGCLLAIFENRVPRMRKSFAFLLTVPVVLVPVYVGLLRFHTTPVLLLLFWPVLHVSIAGLLLHVVRNPYRVLNVEPVMWLGRISYSLYLWQQLFVFGKQPRPWYLAVFAIALAAASYYCVEQPVLRLHERRASELKVKSELVAAA